MKKIYVSGPMTGMPELNFPLFNAVTARLREMGWEVVNPVEINPDPGADWLTCIVADLEAMRGCTDIALLPGHGLSDGSAMEKIAAKRMGCKFHNIEDLIQSEAA
jgi:hypothetical protein